MKYCFFIGDAKFRNENIFSFTFAKLFLRELKNSNICFTPLYKFYKWNPCCTISCFKAFITAFDFMLFSILSTKVA